MTVPVSEVSFVVVSNMKSKVLWDEISVWIHDLVFHVLYVKLGLSISLPFLSFNS